MLEIHNKEYAADVLAEATRKGLLPKLLKQLNYLMCYGQKHTFSEGVVSNDGSDDDGTRVTIGHDFAPLSFSIMWERRDTGGDWQFWMNGGLIFHEGSQDWSCHT